MSDDEADPELLELLRQSLGLSKTANDEVSSDTGVLKDAEYIYNNAIDVSIDMWSTKGAAMSIYKSMQDRDYSTQTWSQQELHPNRDEGFSDVDMVNFVFTLDLLNFSFWSEKSDNERFQVEYRGKRWTGYRSLLACLRRAIEDNIPITTPRFWNDSECTDEKLRYVFRSATDEEMPLLRQRIAMLRESGELLHDSFGDPEKEIEGDEGRSDSHFELMNHPESALSNEHRIDGENGQDASHGSGVRAIADETEVHESISQPAKPSDDAQANNEHLEPDAGQTESNAETGVPPPAEVHIETASRTKPDLSVIRLIEKSDRSAGKLVNLLAKHFPAFRDETRYDGRKVRLLKRAQIFVADLWGAFNGTSYGEFHDIGHLTMFADYRVPQMLHSLGVLVYSPPLDNAIRNLQEISSGHSWEVQMRGCSIWAVELIRREIVRQHPEATEVNAVLIDFLLYDLAKEKEALGRREYPHHRCRSIWY